MDGSCVADVSTNGNARPPSGRIDMRSTFTSIIVAVSLLLLSGTQARAHEGPPYPIVQDKAVGPYLVSIWTDPDVGQASFYVLVNGPPGRTIPKDLRVQLGVQPKS